MAKKKQNTAFNVQVADFIRNHKKAGTAIDDEVTEKLVSHLFLMLTVLMTFWNV